MSEARRVFALALVCACGAQVEAPRTESPRSEAPVEVVAAATVERRDAPAMRLAAHAVYHDDFVRPVLYSWTTAEQAAALRASLRLLVADARTGGRPSPFNQSLAELAARGGPGREVAELLLSHPGLKRRRYAWSSPFATTLGLGPRRYGDALIRIELAPHALLGVFRPAAAEPFAFVDLRGAPVSVAAALAEPARIAGFYHVRDAPGDPVAFREYVICNESALASWSIATPEIAAELDAEVALLEDLRTGPFGHLPIEAALAPAKTAWQGAAASPTAVDLWRASLAFDVAHYRPGAANLAAIAAALRQHDARGGPLTHRPDAPFPADAAQGQQASQTSR